MKNRPDSVKEVQKPQQPSSTRVFSLEDAKGATRPLGTTSLIESLKIDRDTSQEVFGCGQDISLQVITTFLANAPQEDEDGASAKGK